MGLYFAELKNNIVQRVVSAVDNQWCIDNLGGEWVENSDTTSVGDTYDRVNNRFIEPQPYPSWVLDADGKWQAPVTIPSGEECAIYGKCPVWDETTLSWLKI